MDGSSSIPGVKARRRRAERPANAPAAIEPQADTSAPWRGVDWRTRQRWVAIDGASVNVIDVGDGAPVLFVHGLGGSWPNWLGQLPALSARRRAIALDLPGFGHSPMPAGKISIEGYAKMLAELMDSLGLPSAAIVGNSMGGEIAAELAIADPQRVQRLVLVSPGGLSTYAMLRRRVATIRRVYPALAFAGRWVGGHADGLARRSKLRGIALSTVAAKPRQIAPEFAVEQLKGMGKPAFLPSVEAMAAHSLAGRLDAIACPTLVVWGQHDPLIGVRDAEVFARDIPGARKVIWPDTGHVSMFERTDDFNALLEAFLDE